ncbi:MAG: methionine gamma-lyase family protein, partial [Clostridiaceae bacterium]
MIEKTRQLLKTRYRISDELLDLHDRVLEELTPELSYYDEIREYNQLKVTRAFHEERISDSMFSMSSGYGYGDLGRDKLDAVYARVFG